MRNVEVCCGVSEDGISSDRSLYEILDEERMNGKNFEQLINEIIEDNLSRHDEEFVMIAKLMKSKIDHIPYGIIIPLRNENGAYFLVNAKEKVSKYIQDVSQENKRISKADKQLRFMVSPYEVFG